LNRRVLVMAVVVLLHALLLAAAWFARIELPPREETPLMAAVLREPTPDRHEKPPALPPLRFHAPVPAVIIDDFAVIPIAAIEDAPAPSPEVQIAPPAASPAVTEPLGTELAIQCPQRTPPRYPPLAKRQREQGEVRLRVELDESGRIDRVTIVSSSGSPRLDEAARTAIESWRCRPAERDGQPVRAVALQSLAFVLERH